MNIYMASNPENVYVVALLLYLLVESFYVALDFVVCLMSWEMWLWRLHWCSLREYGYFCYIDVDSLQSQLLQCR